MSGSRVVDVGTPPSVFEDWTTTMVRFHNFADLPTTKDEGIDSPKFTCFRHDWSVRIFPGGSDDSDEGYVSVHLVHMSSDEGRSRFNQRRSGAQVTKPKI